MNTSQIKGACLTMLGQVQLAGAYLTGNPRWEQGGHRKLVEGKASLAIGEARELIKLCLARRTRQPGGMERAL